MGSVSCSGINNESWALLDVLAITEYNALRLKRNLGPLFATSTKGCRGDGLIAPLSLFFGLLLLCLLTLGIVRGGCGLFDFINGGGSDRSPWGLSLTAMGEGTLFGHSAEEQRTFAVLMDVVGGG